MRPGLAAGALGPSIVSLNTNKSYSRSPPWAGLGPVRNPVLQHRMAPCFPWFLSFGNLTQNSRAAGARPNLQPIGGSDPNHLGIWCPPSAVCGGVMSPVTKEKNHRNFILRNVCLTAGPSTKLFAWGGEDSGGHVLRETTSRGLCVGPVRNPVL